MINGLMIISFIILVIFLINTFGSMGEGSMGPVIIGAAMAMIFISYYDNANVGWLNIGAQASKSFMIGLVGCLILGFVVYYTFYTKEEISEWINKHKSKQSQ